MRSITLYKYLPPDEGSLKVVSASTIKFTSPIDFNDPFDSRPIVNVEKSLENYMGREEFINKLMDARGINSTGRATEIHRIRTDLKSYLESGRSVTTFLSRTGILCLSKTFENTLMWSHYAKHHKGFVLEFEIPLEGYEFEELRAIELLVPQTVSYQEERPEIVNGTQEDEKELKKQLDKQFFIKQIDWRYEEEERVVDYIRGPGIHSYEPSLLKSVIFGMKMEEEYESKLVDAISQSDQDLKLWQCIESKTFKVNIVNKAVFSD